MAHDQRRLTAIVSADVAGYSRLMGRGQYEEQLMVAEAMQSWSSGPRSRASWTIGAIKTWMRPTAPLAGYEPLYDGLRMTGVREDESTVTRPGQQ